MSSKKILQNPLAVNQQGKNAFDMSQITAFTSTTGQLLPVYCDLLNPGEKIKFKANWETYCAQMRESAFTRLTEKVDYFFVPLSQMYSQWDSFWSGKDLNYSSMFGSAHDNPVRIPLLTNATLMNWLKTLDFTDNSNHVDMFGVPKLANAVRLLDLLGYGRLTVQQLYETKETSSTIAPYKYNIFRLLAYQKIYFDYYRLADRESNDPYYYNLDYFVDRNSQSILDATYPWMYLTMHYHPLKKDFFTYTFPSPLASSYSKDASTSLGVGVKSYIGSSSALRITDASSGAAVTSDAGAQVATSLATGTTGSIRSMFALEKLLEVTRRAGHSLDSVTRAIFGAKPSKILNNQVIFLGSESQPISIGQVVSQAGASVQDGLGERAGKGYALKTNGDMMSFETDVHGIFMAIHSVIPETDYDSLGLDRENQYSERVDFFLPQFDNLGMQPLFHYQAKFNSETLTNNASIIGWQYRYMEAKMKYDRICCGFNYQSLRSWVTKRDTDQYLSYINSGVMQQYYVSPTYCNSIFVPEFNAGVESTEHPMDFDTIYEDDPFYHRIEFKVTKISTMNTYGLPSL